MIAANDPERAGQRLEVSASRMATGGSPYLRDIRETAVGSFLGGQLLRAPMSVLSAVEELSLCREAASRSVVLYAKARDLELAHPDDAKYSAMADRAGVLMQEQLQLIVGMIEAAARITSNVSRAYSYASLCEISRIMLTVCGDVLGDDRPDLLAEISARLRSEFGDIRPMEPEQNLVLDEMKSMDCSLDTQ